MNFKILMIQRKFLDFVNLCIGYRAVPRSILLYKQSFHEENLKPPRIHQPKLHLPLIIYYPRSYIQRASSLNYDKEYDYNFLGALFRDCVYENRKWIVDFAKHNFTENSYYNITDAKQDYKPIGVFDYTLRNQQNIFIPSKEKGSNKLYFDAKYFQIMCKSKFTLCPAGDAPWSMRFFESVLCKSIPILESPHHSGRGVFEKSIGYKFYTLSDNLEYREDWVEENYQRFLKSQTLILNSRFIYLRPIYWLETILTGVDYLARACHHLGCLTKSLEYAGLRQTNYSCHQINATEEIDSTLVVARRYPPILLELGKKVLNAMTAFI